ncbi:probable carboxylesterase 13 [Lycium barbarum]|uniref:probable carboxylesterase 13 n=1 Tax=Lycium barbarum TaxID=112863 RepID=UPI00293EBA22|nr:probable carboxylesterase 13 [Lycium barbarum]
MTLHFTHLHFPLLLLIICLCMNSTLAGIAHNFYPFFEVDADGTVHRFQEIKFVPPSNNPKTGVQSKDVTILPEQNVSARLYLPKISEKNQKFPLLFYVHGGGFCTQSAFSPTYDSYLHRLTAAANVVAVSIDYRLAPEHPIPSCYDDSWAVMNWAAQGKEPWLKEHANFSRVFLAGDSAGANIAHNMMVRASEESHFLPSLVGMALIDPYFGNGKPDGLFTYLCPKSNGIDDPRFNPAAHPMMLSKLNCSKILVCTAGKDFLRDRAWTYYETMKKSGWKGQVGIKEIEGEGHVFHLFNQTSEKAKVLMKSLVEFLV